MPSAAGWELGSLFIVDLNYCLQTDITLFFFFFVEVCSDPKQQVVVLQKNWIKSVFPCISFSLNIEFSHSGRQQMLYFVISVTRCLNPHSSWAASLATEDFIRFLLWASRIPPMSGPLQYLDSLCQHFQRSLEEDLQRSVSVYDLPIICSITRWKQDFWGPFLSLTCT